MNTSNQLGPTPDDCPPPPTDDSAAVVAAELLEAATGKRPLPDADECRRLAEKLGAPPEPEREYTDADLLPCPFCGSSAMLLEYDADPPDPFSPKWYQACCYCPDDVPLRCPTFLGDDTFTTAGIAVRAWNRRLGNV